MRSARAYLSMAGDQVEKLISSDAPNYTSSFTASTLFFIFGTAARLSDSPMLGYVAYAMALGELAVATKQYTAARFFAQNHVVRQPAHVANLMGDASVENEDFHSAEEHKIKKSQ